MDNLLALYNSWCGKKPAKIEKLPQSGSNRVYYRLIDEIGKSVIGVIGESKEENQAFIYLCRHFTHQKLAVPELLAVGDDGLRYLQSDLGCRSLYDALAEGRSAGGRYTREERQLLKRTISELPRIQIWGAVALDYNQCYPQPEFDKKGVLFDLNYFKYCFLKATGIDFNELKLEANFELIATDLLSVDSLGFLYRDFQARNVMLNAQGNPYFIDFQGGRKGPIYYDLASFLWQASAHYSTELREELIKVYFDSLKHYKEVPDFRVFNDTLQLFVLFRILQVLGAYGFRGYFEHKSHFIESIPGAMDNLRELLSKNKFPYPYLVSILKRMLALPQFAPKEEEEAAARKDGYRISASNIYKAYPQDGPATYSKYDGRGPLIVKVYSFAYSKGIPEDDSGNGGGYVFDCRSTHNPGRYEPYKDITGLDEPVIRFLEDDGEILTFLDSIYRLADMHVARYLQRGFTSLMFAFGCTGGQHRSVYSAQHLAEHLNKKFGVEVRVCHREQQINRILPAHTIKE
ncbi:MAG: RNase adapter RapZ [Bacteroidaceae bacterium]